MLGCKCLHPLYRRNHRFCVESENCLMNNLGDWGSLSVSHHLLFTSALPLRSQKGGLKGEGATETDARQSFLRLNVTVCPTGARIIKSSLQHKKNTSSFCRCSPWFSFTRRDCVTFDRLENLSRQGKHEDSRTAGIRIRLRFIGTSGFAHHGGFGSCSRRLRGNTQTKGPLIQTIHNANNVQYTERK